MMTTNCINAPLPVAISQGGTGQTTQAAAFNALAPTPSKVGDMIYSPDGVAWALLPASIVDGTHVLTAVVSGGIVTSLSWS